MFFKLVTLSLQTTSDLEICSIQVSFWSFLRSNYVVLQIISDSLTIFSYCLDKIDGILLYSNGTNTEALLGSVNMFIRKKKERDIFAPKKHSHKKQRSQNVTFGRRQVSIIKFKWEKITMKYIENKGVKRSCTPRSSIPNGRKQNQFRTNEIKTRQAVGCFLFHQLNF